MDMTFRPMLPAEQNYTYTQSQQISMQTGCIGHLRADMDTDGNGFFSSWDDFRKDLKTDEFKTEFDEVINALRFDEQYGGILKTRSDMSRFCREHADSEFDGNYCKEYGFRADTEKYAYLFRLNPTKGDYNLYCYCYVQDWLDGHIKKAERGIRFIDPHYTEKFRIPDGDKVRITSSWGEKNDYTCRYIDDYHLEVGNNLYHICELAERMDQNGATITPLRSSLPEQCYGMLESTGEIVIITRGETGFCQAVSSGTDKEENRELVNEYNGKLGVSKAQAEAMKAGSMFGFAVPAADPKSYDEDGTPIRPKQKDRGDAR